MAYPSVYSSEFQQACRIWLEESGEVFALFRYSHAAGSRDYEFFTNDTELQNRIAHLPPQTCVTVWGEHQMPLRGVIDEAFIARALEQVPDANEWLLIGLDRVIYGSASWYRNNSGMSLAELAAELPDYAGERIAIGLHPAWSDGGREVSAVVPDADGTVITGVY